MGIATRMRIFSKASLADLGRWYGDPAAVLSDAVDEAEKEYGRLAKAAERIAEEQTGLKLDAEAERSEAEAFRAMLDEAMAAGDGDAIRKAIAQESESRAKLRETEAALAWCVSSYDAMRNAMEDMERDVIIVKAKVEALSEKG